MILLMNVDKDNPSVAEGENVQIQGAGLTGFELKGNTHQDSYTGKNLFNYNIIDVSTITIDNDGTILISDTESSNGYTSTSKTLSQLCPSLQVGDIVYLYLESDWTLRQYIYSSALGSWSNGQSRTITQEMLDGGVILYGGYQTTSHLKIMITNQLETSFEPYVGEIPSPNPDYPQPVKVVTGDNTINVHGKNLFDKDNANILNAYISLRNSKITSSNSDKCLYMPIKNNTTYTISKILSSRFVIGCADELPVVNTTICNPISGNQATDTTYTITSGNNSQYLVVFYYTTSDTLTEQQIRDSIQIEENPTATEYQPYQGKDYEISLGNIELCKIGDYQDYIYKENNKWYKHSEIGKVVLDGSESYNSLGGSGSNPYYVFYNNNTLVSNAITNSTLYANYFITDYTSGLLQKDGGCRITEYNSVNRVFFCIHSITSVNDFKTWLSTHNTTVYYVLATPTNTEITDTDLIEQLEAISNIALFEGVNNISMESSNLTSSFKVYYDTWYEFDKILRNGYNIREDRDRITQKFANGHRKQFVSDYVDCSITLNLDTIDKDTTQDYLQRLKSGAYKYYSIDGKEYRTAQFIIENKPELSVESSISNNVDVNEYQITLLKAGD